LVCIETSFAEFFAEKGGAMSLARFAKKRDLNEATIVQALRSAGARVWQLDRPFDLLVGLRGRFTVLEVKSTKRPRKDQQHQTDEIRDCQADGLPVHRVQTPAEALAAVGLT
jgi:hypothetical protein